MTTPNEFAGLPPHRDKAFRILEDAIRTATPRVPVPADGASVSAEQTNPSRDGRPIRDEVTGGPLGEVPDRGVECAERSRDAGANLQPDATARNRVQPDATSAQSRPQRTNPARALTPRQLAAARAFAAGASVRDVARLLAVNRTTLWRWQRDPAFARELGRLHRRLSVAGFES